MKVSFGIFCSLMLVFSLHTRAQQFVDKDVTIHKVVLYPNPLVGEAFTIKANVPIKEVEVVNVIGKSINRTENNNIELKELSVNLGNCTKGIYLVKISFDDNKFIIKKLFVK